ncbi:MAG TPA: hypothetical protein EYN66_10485 [Myxococcales bacterium]|nr:hypothetical protein [Myxococcales bacterium]
MNPTIANPYDSTAALIAELRTAGLQQHADELQLALDTGSSGTRIFMALRWQLEEMQKHELPESVREQTRFLGAYFSKALEMDT